MSASHDERYVQRHLDFRYLHFTFPDRIVSETTIQKPEKAKTTLIPETPELDACTDTDSIIDEEEESIWHTEDAVKVLAWGNT